MLGAIDGDIIGSRFEIIMAKSIDFDFFTGLDTFIDDTVLTITIADDILYRKYL